MNKLEVYNVKLEEVASVVERNIKSCEGTLILPKDDKYHSCAKIEAVPHILEEGLLSKRLRRGTLTEDEEYRFSDPHCVNGADNISLSTMNPEIPFSAMYKDEDYYDSFYTPYPADFVMGSTVKASSVTTNYINEMLVSNCVSPNDFTGINVRILREIQMIEQLKISNDDKIQQILKLYNDFRIAAIALKDFNNKREDGGIPLMEDSNRPYVTLPELQAGKKYTNEGVIGLNIEKVSSLPKIYVK